MRFCEPRSHDINTYVIMIFLISHSSFTERTKYQRVKLFYKELVFSVQPLFVYGSLVGTSLCRNCFIFSNTNSPLFNIKSHLLFSRLALCLLIVVIINILSAAMQTFPFRYFSDIGLTLLFTFNR